MAGSDTGLPRGSRGNGGWRPLKRDQSRPQELAGLDEGGEREGSSPFLLILSFSFDRPASSLDPDPSR